MSNERAEYQARSLDSPECVNCGRTLVEHDFDQSVPTWYCRGDNALIDPEKEREAAKVAERCGLTDERARRGARLAQSYKNVPFPSTEDVVLGSGKVHLNVDPPPASALDTQVGGEHYKGCAIQPVVFAEANGLSFLEGCIVKRVTRHGKPTGKGRQDIEKAIHELQLLLELRYGEGDTK